MIELSRQFPSPEMLERLAGALEIEAQELFSMPPSERGALQSLRVEVLDGMRRELNAVFAGELAGLIITAMEQAMDRVIADHLGKGE
jgi:transcriptional regulator with XRE-family HTH domain